jgi:pimeloyl-ACP methyl ester carboxylesterase
MKRKIALFVLSIPLIVIVGFIGLVIAVNAQEFQTPQELADPDGQFADVNGVSVYYRAQGDPTNPPVILIHGFGGSTFTWRDTLPALAEAGFYAVALDLPPFGLSDKSPDIDYSRSGMADIVAGFMDTLGIPRADIVGHSMGGAVTAQFAVRHPDKVNRLVFVAGGVFEAMRPAEGQQQETSGASSALSLLNSIDPRSPLAPSLLRVLVTEQFFINTIRTAYADPDMVTPEVAAGYARILKIQDAPVGFLAYLQAQETAPITLADLAAATQDVEVLLMWGDQDTWVSPRLADSMEVALANVQRADFAGIGHLPMEETVEPFNAALIAFLSS